MRPNWGCARRGGSAVHGAGAPFGVYAPAGEVFRDLVRHGGRLPGSRRAGKDLVLPCPPCPVPSTPDHPSRTPGATDPAPGVPLRPLPGPWATAHERSCSTSVVNRRDPLNPGPCEVDAKASQCPPSPPGGTFGPRTIPSARQRMGSQPRGPRRPRQEPKMPVKTTSTSQLMDRASALRDAAARRPAPDREAVSHV